MTNPSGTAPQQGKKHILVVDDEPLNRQLLHRTLRSSYRVTEACDSQEALEILESAVEVSAIVSDHLMPGKTGAELAFIVRDRWPDIPFILVTGYEGDELVRQAEDQGIIRKVVAKPWNGRQLHELIASYL